MNCKQISSRAGNITAKLFFVGAVTMASPVFAQEVDQALHDQLPETIKAAGVIKMGGAFESYPHLITDPNNASKPIGIAADLSNLLAPILGVEIQWVNTAWPGQIPGLRSGTLDALMGQISVTAEREKELMDFVPYIKEVSGTLVVKGNPESVTADVSSLCGLTVGTVAGSLMGQELNGISEKYCPATGNGEIDVAEFPSASHGSTALLSGQVQAYFESYASANGIAGSSSGRLEAISMDYEQTKEWNPGLRGIAVTKENAGITTAFHGAMSKLLDNGEYRKVLEKYDVAEGALSPEEMQINPLTDTPAGTVAK